MDRCEEYDIKETKLFAHQTIFIQGTNNYGIHGKMRKIIPMVRSLKNLSIGNEQS